MYSVPLNVLIVIRASPLHKDGGKLKLRSSFSSAWNNQTFRSLRAPPGGGNKVFFSRHFLLLLHHIVLLLYFDLSDSYSDDGWSHFSCNIISCSRVFSVCFSTFTALKDVSTSSLLVNRFVLYKVFKTNQPVWRRSQIRNELFLWSESVYQFLLFCSLINKLIINNNNNKLQVWIPDSQNFSALLWSREQVIIIAEWTCTVCTAE